MIDGNYFDHCQSRFQTKKHSSGLTIIHLPVTTDQRFYLSTVFKVGSSFDHKKYSGISHFLEHMMFRGSRNYPSFKDLANAFEWLGGEWNGATGIEHTEYSFGSILSSASQAIELFADFLTYPLLLDLDREREIILREIDDQLNEFGHSIDLDQHMKEVLWPNCTLSQPILGHSSSVKNIDSDDLHRFRQTYYTPERCVVSIVGGEKTEKYFDLVEEKFVAFTEQNLQSSQKSSTLDPNKLIEHAGPKSRWVENSDNQFHLMLSFPCEGEWSPLATSYQIICAILADGFSARLNRRLREELGLVYDISADTQLLSRRGSIDISTSVAIKSWQKALREICWVIQQLKKSGPSPDELSKAKKRAQIDLYLSMQDQETQAFQLAWSHLCHEKLRYKKDFQQLSSLTQDDFLHVSQQVFSADNSAVVLLGPAKKSSSSLAAEAQNILSECLA